MTAPPANPSPSVPGALLGGKYEAEMLLGEGGFASVFRARHAQIPSLRVAIKLLRPEHANNAEVVQRFYGEAQTAAALRNPHTVRIMDIGHTADGRPFIVMEYVDGASLDRVLARCATLRPVSVARLSAGILRALDEAHALGIVHRDMKPGNVMVVKERGSAHPIARVLDFGIAKVAEDAALGLAASRSTMGGSIFCTPQYAAPEVLRGEAQAASDVYALGHMMIEMLGGRPAYHRGSPFEIAARQLDAQPVPMPEGLERTALGRVVARAVQKRVEDRWGSAAEMLDAVDAIWQQMQLAAAGRVHAASAQPAAAQRAAGAGGGVVNAARVGAGPDAAPAIAATPAPEDDGLVDEPPQSPRTIGMLARALEIEGAENDSEANVATQPFHAEVAARARAAALARAPGGRDDAPTAPRAAVAEVEPAAPVAPQQRLAARGRVEAVSGVAPTVALRSAALSDDHAAARRGRSVVWVGAAAALVLAVAGAGVWTLSRGAGDTGTAGLSGSVAAASAAVAAAAVPSGAHRFTFAANVEGGSVHYRDQRVADLPVFDLFGPSERPIEVRFRHPDYLGVTVTFDAPGPVSFRVPFSAAP